MANTLAYYNTATITVFRNFIVGALKVNGIKPFTVVIYCHSMVILSLCVINFSNYHEMAVNDQGVVNAAFLFFETSKLWALIMYIL